MFQILVVDDDPQLQFFLKEALARQQFAVTVEASAEAALRTLKAAGFDLILMDVRFQDMGGLDAIDEIQRIDSRTPIIVMTPHGTRETALEAIRRGAYDYVTKPFRVDEMEIIIRRALERKRLSAEVEQLREQLEAADRPLPPPAGTAPQVGSDALQAQTLDEKVTHLERALVVDALSRAGGVQAAAARLLGVTERSVWHLVKKHRIEVSRLKQRRAEE